MVGALGTKVKKSVGKKKSDSRDSNEGQKMPTPTRTVIWSPIIRYIY